MLTSQPPTDAVQALLAAGLLTPEQVAAARDYGQARGQETLPTLIEQGVVTQADVVRVGAEAAGFTFVELADYPVNPAAVARMSGEHARRYQAVPVDFDDQNRLIVAVTIKSAANIMVRDDLQRATRSAVHVVVALRTDILAKIAEVYRAEGEIDDLVSDIAGSQVEEDLANLSAAAPDDAPIVRFVNLLITQAITDRASDIHIEPGESDLRVRYRIDGVLHETTRSPKNIQSGVISRLKIMADINIAERRVPQDGRMSVTHTGRRVDLRVATLPTVWGEKVVMRILDNTATRMDLTDLGFRDTNFTRYRTAYSKPYGMILVTGPTGSGKSTTLYATLNQVSKPDVNVITVEDPVEYRIPGINQVQVNQKAGLTFATALRSILRSDPDIVLVGEIRDHETAQIAVEAALTGHLVLSTLHTNDAPSAMTRLVEMGIEPFLVGSALDVVLAQRLCRRLCVKCKEPYTPAGEDLTNVGFPWQPGTPLPTLYRPVGCSACSRTGFKGRMALHEVMVVSEEIERLTVSRAGADTIARVAVAEGMEGLRADGWAKCLDGVTSIEEVLRVVA